MANPFRPPKTMIIEPCNLDRFDDWVRLRCALWPDDTLEEHRKYAASIIERTKDARVYIARDEDTVVGFAEATLRHDYVNGCATSPVGLRGSMSSRLIAVAGLRGYLTMRWNDGLQIKVARSLVQMFC